MFFVFASNKKTKKAHFQEELDFFAIVLAVENVIILVAIVDFFTTTSTNIDG